MKTFSRKDIEGIAARVCEAYKKLPEFQGKPIYKIEPEKLVTDVLGLDMEGQVINRALSKLINDNNLPPVVFHSFRHASITFKLKWTEGDIKSVQGDSGHARADMVADVYSHILDEDRAINAQRFDEKFYGKADEEKEDPTQEQPQGAMSIQEMLMGVLTNPELSKAFQEFFQQQQAAKQTVTQ